MVAHTHCSAGVHLAYSIRQKQTQIQHIQRQIHAQIQKENTGAVAGCTQYVSLQLLLCRTSCLLLLPLAFFKAQLHL